MKKIAFMLALAAGLASTANAQSAPPQSATAAPPALTAAPGPQDALDPTQFCYFAGNAYSEGAVLDGRRCSRENNGIVGPGKPRPQLLWIRAIQP